MSYKHGGIKDVQYDTAGNNFAAAVSLGKPLSESEGYTPEIPEVENGAGQMLYAGKKNNGVYLIPDLTKFAALETIMKADTEVDVRVRYLDDSYETVALATLIKVRHVINTAVGSRNAFEFKFNNFEV